MAKLSFLNSFMEMNEIQDNMNLKICNIKELSKKIIHSNPIYLFKSDARKKEFIIKFHKTRDIMKNERFCNLYLENKGLCVPKIVSYSKSSRPYIIMEKINGKEPSKRDIPKRIKDLARVHVESLRDANLNSKMLKITNTDRIRNLEKNIRILQSNPFVKEDDINKFISLVDICKKIDYGLWGQCFCFNDFFINNSIKSGGKVYYFDFEKAVVASPFVDVGCMIIDYPEKYSEIKSLYIKNITKLIKENQPNLGFFIDFGVCEKIIEDAAFLSNDSIKKTKSNSYCKKLAKRKIESVSFVFNNLKNSFIGEK